MSQQHGAAIRAAALVAKLRHDRASFEALIAAAEAIEQLDRDHHAEITSREQVRADLDQAENQLYLAREQTKWDAILKRNLAKDRDTLTDQLAAVKAERDGLGRMVHDKAVQLQRAERALRDACDYLGSNRLNTIGSGSQLHRQMADALDDNANNRF